MAICTNCGNKVPDDIKFCVSCGAALAAEGTEQLAPQLQPVSQPQSVQQPPIYGSGPTASCSTTCGCLHGRAYHDRRLYWHFFVADAPAHQYDMSYYLGMRRLS